MSNCVTAVKPRGAHGAKSINVTNARYSSGRRRRSEEKAPVGVGGVGERTYAGTPFVLWGFLIGPLPDHKRIFDVYAFTCKLYIFFFLFFALHEAPSGEGGEAEGGTGERNRVARARVLSSAS